MNKRALICGVSGQDGTYVAKLLLEQGYEVAPVGINGSSPEENDTPIFSTEYSSIPHSRGKATSQLRNTRPPNGVSEFRINSDRKLLIGMLPQLLVPELRQVLHSLDLKAATGHKLHQAASVLRNFASAFKVKVGT
jgi:hypothetical protein